MKVTDTKFAQGFIKMCNDGWNLGWHERNGGNLSYRMKKEETEEILPCLDRTGEWREIGTTVPGLAGEFFMVTGSGKYFRNVILDPEDSTAIIEIDEKGENYRICWGLVNGGRPTSELPSHLMNHEVKKEVSQGLHRVIYHAHTPNVIALTFVLPLKDEIFTRELWEMATECPVGMEGKEVHLVEMRDQLAPDANVRHRPLLLAEIEKYVTVHTGFKGKQVTDQGILCEDKEGKEHFVPGTTVICALGQRSRTDMGEKLRDAAPYVAVIGDAAKVSTITNAVYWGYHAALDI